jgi:serine protease DegS
LLDIEGRVAGINTMIFSQSGGNEGLGFAIPANLAKDVYQKLRKDGRVRRGSIGVIPETITPTLGAALGLDRDSGVILSDVAPHGAAEAAELEPGDVVLVDRRQADARGAGPGSGGVRAGARRPVDRWRSSAARSGCPRRSPCSSGRSSPANWRTWSTTTPRWFASWGFWR